MFLKIISEERAQVQAQDEERLPTSSRWKSTEMESSLSMHLSHREFAGLTNCIKKNLTSDG